MPATPPKQRVDLLPWLDEADTVDEDVNTGMIRLNINVVPISSNFSFG